MYLGITKEKKWLNIIKTYLYLVNDNILNKYLYTVLNVY